MRCIALILAVAVLVSVTSARKLHSDKCDAEKGEEFTSCGTACPDTCDNYNEIRICTLQCVIGCACPRGTVRRVSDNYCVKVEEC